MSGVGVYEDGVMDERAAILEYLERRLESIIRTIGRACLENVCDELETVMRDIRAERHL